MAPPLVESTPQFVESTYRKMEQRLSAAQRSLSRSFTYAEKLLFGHLDVPATASLTPGQSYLLLRPDRVALQDVTGQMAILQFMQAGKSAAAVPTTVHCDHLIQAYVGADKDTKEALISNREVYEFLRSASNKYGLGFWGPGSGIIHQVVLENYAFPGSMIVGTDSHTPNAGGLASFAAGVGGADAVDVMADFPWEVLYPKLIGVHLTGELNGWTAPKDVILKLAGILKVTGGTNAVIEYFGSGVSSLSCTGKATVANMGAELGATTSVFPYDERMRAYLRGTGRQALADLADRHRHLLAADPEVLAKPESFFDQVVEIDLSALEPHLVGPHTPDLARPLSEVATAVATEGYTDEISVSLVGSCTNSSYEDVSRAADVARQAAVRGARMLTPLLVSPGSEMVHATIQRDGQMRDLEAIGAVVMANACGPCIGQWRRDEIRQGEQNTIVTSFNRNFPRRNDGNAGTMAFIASPEIVMALGLAGRLSFNPAVDVLVAPDGTEWRLDPPTKAPDLPPEGFVGRGFGYEPPADKGDSVVVNVASDSQRLQLLAPFPAWDGRDFERLPLLLKASGKCTTDHISPAGPWLRFRGHLDRISDNAFLGVVNAFTGEAGIGLNQETGERTNTFPTIARDYKARGLRWVVVGDQNYGEGSSREHAAMSPRFLGCAAVIVRSFARIHESNLKKQGILPLTFVDPSDYDLVQESDRVSVSDLANLEPERNLSLILHHLDGSQHRVQVRHTLNGSQIEWFKAGAALNMLRPAG